MIVNVCLPCLANHYHICETNEVAVDKKELEFMIGCVEVYNANKAYFFADKYLKEVKK